MDPGPAAINDAAHASASVIPENAAFDAAEFDYLTDMIGADGVEEMVGIFETETRQRLRRLAAGNQDILTQMREMHTLKGAASTVAAPRLASLARMLEHAALRWAAPTQDDLKAIEIAMEEFLSEARKKSRRDAGFEQPLEPEAVPGFIR